MRTPIVTLSLAAALLLAATGCSRGDKPVPPVDARNLGAYTAWRSEYAYRFSPEQWREFEAALQEIRMRAMSSGVSGRDAVTAQLCEAINGHTFNEVLRLGGEAKLARLEVLRAELKRMVDANALVVGRSDDPIAVEKLDKIRSEQQQRLRDLLAEMRATADRIVALGGTPATPVSEADAAPAVLSRTQALYEINRLISSRRAAAMDRWGPDAVEFDETGAALNDEDKTEFRLKRAAAAGNGHTVTAVRIRDTWRIFDAKIDYPVFSPVVATHLTEADLRTIEKQWRDVEIEAWARRTVASAKTVGVEP